MKEKLEDKIKSLGLCFLDNYFEDAATHLCDLLEYCRTRCEDDNGKIFSCLESMVGFYGKNPVPIERGEE